MELRGRHEADGTFGPEGIVVNMRPLTGPTQRQLAAVYMYAMEVFDRPPDGAMRENMLPVPPEEMAAALNAVIAGAGEELVWTPPAKEGEMPEQVRGVIDSFVESLRARGFAASPEDVEVVQVGGQGSAHFRGGGVDMARMARGGVIPHQPDGDPIPEQDARSVAEEVIQAEKDRYLRLADTVLVGLRRIYSAVAEDASGDQVMAQVRVMAAAIGEADLILAVDHWLTEHGVQPGPSPEERDQAIRFARAILARQIEMGQAQTRWEERRGSRDERIATAETILRTDRVGGAVGQSVDSDGWVQAVTGALMAERNLSPATASQIALRAREVLQSRPDWYTHTVVSRGRTAAEAS